MADFCCYTATCSLGGLDAWYDAGAHHTAHVSPRHGATEARAVLSGVEFASPGHALPRHFFVSTA